MTFVQNRENKRIPLVIMLEKKKRSDLTVSISIRNQLNLLVFPKKYLSNPDGILSGTCIQGTHSTG